MSGNTTGWFRCAPCSDSVDNEEFFCLLEGPGGWPPKLRGKCCWCFREYEASHLDRDTELVGNWWGTGGELVGLPNSVIIISRNVFLIWGWRETSYHVQ